MKLNIEQYYHNVPYLSLDRAIKKQHKKSDNIPFRILNFNEYNELLGNNYNLQQIKQLCKSYHIPVTGTKPKLISQLYYYLYLSSKIIVIQSYFRKFIQKRINHLHGPGYLNRSICTNDTDFSTLDSLEDIPNHQFISYKDTDGFIYGFDISSIYSLCNNCNQGEKCKNPYNRNIMPSSIFANVNIIKRLYSIFNKNVILEVSQPSKALCNDVNMRSVTLFHEIDNLGHYTSSSWFSILTKHQLEYFIYELMDIWVYRSQITNELRCQICPPHGKPFQRFSKNIFNNRNIKNIQLHILHIMELIINTGISQEMKYLGSSFVLCALTTVSNDAAIALPWFYQSMHEYF